MKSLLITNVPRFIQHIKDRGGVSAEELRWLQCEEAHPDYPMEVMMRADEYLLYPKNQEVFEKGLFVLVLALAIMSFVPGGVRFLGLHFCSQIKDFVTREDETKT